MPPETPLAQEQHHNLEAGVIRRVHGKDKTIKSNLIARSNVVMTKKHRITLLMVEASKSRPSELDILREQLVEVNQ